MKNIYLDCGRHFGEGLEHFCKKLRINNEWKIYSFEANPVTHDFFIKNKKIKFLDLDCEFIHSAVMDFSGETEMLIASNESELEMSGGSSCLSINTWNPRNNFEKSYSRTIKVPCVNFSNFVKNLPKSANIYCKLDIEGAEFDVIESMIENGSIQRIRKFWIEFHENFTTKKKFYKQRKKNITDFFKKNSIQYEEWR